MRKVLVILGVVIALLAALAVGVVLAFPQERVRLELLRAVESASGRAVAVNGPVKLMIYPVLGLEAQDVRLANAPGGQAPSLLQAEAVAIGVKLLPLLRGDVQVKRLELIKPVLALEVSAAGEPNWLLNTKPTQSGPEIQALSLADVRVIDGALSFTSLIDSVRYDVSDIDLTASLANLDSPLSLAGNFTYRNERTEADLTVGRPKAFLQPGATPIRLELSGGTALGALEGALDVATGAITGTVDVRGENFRRLSAWVGAPLGPGPGFGPYSAQGEVRIAEGAVQLSKADLALDALRATGAVTLAMGEKRPKLSGDLRLPTLDLNTYLAPSAEPKGMDVQEGWSEEPFDFSGLKGMDTDLRLRAGALLFQKLRLEDADVLLRINGGLLDADLRSMTLYGGRGQGRLQLDASGAMPRFAQALTVEDIQALPFLTDAIGLDRLAGLARLEISVAGAGRSQNALMRDLRGSMALAVRDGEIKGLSLGEIARTVRAALTGGAVGPASETDFGSFAGSFTIKEGVAATNDLSLQAPFLRMGGAGLIDIGQQKVDLRLTPKAVGSTQGQGASSADAGIGVPFRVSGRWSELKFSPDLAGVAQALIQNQLQKFLGGAGLGGLFGQKPEQQPTEPSPAAENPAGQKPAQTEKPKGGSLLDSILKAAGGG